MLSVLASAVSRGQPGTSLKTSERGRSGSESEFGLILPTYNKILANDSWLLDFKLWLPISIVNFHCFHLLNPSSKAFPSRSFYTGKACDFAGCIDPATVHTTSFSSPFVSLPQDRSSNGQQSSACPIAAMGQCGSWCYRCRDCQCPGLPIRHVSAAIY